MHAFSLLIAAIFILSIDFLLALNPNKLKNPATNSVRGRPSLKPFNDAVNEVSNPSGAPSESPPVFDQYEFDGSINDHILYPLEEPLRAPTSHHEMQFPDASCPVTTAIACETSEVPAENCPKNYADETTFRTKFSPPKPTKDLFILYNRTNIANVLLNKVCIVGNKIVTFASNIYYEFTWKGLLLLTREVNISIHSNIYYNKSAIT